MNFRRQFKRKDSGKKLPLEIYSSIVKSLYADELALMVGAFSTLIAASILYARTVDLTHMIFALAISLVGIKRIWDSKAFKEEWPNIENVRKNLAAWEHQYLVWASVHVALLGFWCFMVSARSSDDFVLLMTISITLANLIGITGRNFGSEKVVTAQLVWAAIPLVSGSFLFGDFYHALMGAFLIPFFVAIKLMAGRLRNILLASTESALTNQLIANRFDAALNNISHGIAMINDSQKFVVINENFADLAGVGDQKLMDRELTDIMNSNVANFEDGEPNIFADIGKCLSDGQSRRNSYVLKDKRIIEYNYSPMKEGGVILLEDVSLRVASEAEIRILAKFDPLTHLPNRRFFMEEVHRLLYENGELKPCSLFFIDLDKFKEINDSLGHTTGDKLLNSIAIRLKSIISSDSLICRFGGDEFVLIVPNLIDKQACGRFVEEMICEISKPLMLDGNQIVVGATVGISSCPANASDPDLLLKYSDAALYQAKSIGRGTYSYYSEELGVSIKEKRQLELDLRKAIDRGQFMINYQPLVNVAKNKIFTCEALVRWNHPVRGLVTPDKFIPIAEDTGFINQLGIYVMENAALQCLEWPEHMSVAVNVSSVQFQQSDMAKVVSNVLEKTGLAPHRLEIEVTESALLEDVDSTNEMLLRISKLGVKISLDDFGTGFSSLSYLHRLPLDKVKIDRSFISNIDRDERSLLLLEGISKLSHSLGLKIVVEGVESVDQLDLLQKYVHVDEVQGFLFGKALPPENLVALLDGKASLYAAQREQKTAVG